MLLLATPLVDYNSIQEAKIIRGTLHIMRCEAASFSYSVSLIPILASKKDFLNRL